MASCKTLIPQIIVVLLLTAVFLRTFVTVEDRRSRAVRISSSVDGNITGGRRRLTSISSSVATVVRSEPSTAVIDAIDPIAITRVYSREMSSTCRRQVQHLWSKRGDPQPDSKLPPCSALFDSLITRSPADTMEERAKMFADAAAWQVPEPHDNTSVWGLVKNCRKFLAIADFAHVPGSREESNFPLAFVVTVTADSAANIAQTIRLFRMIYQPQNAYCINYDTRLDGVYKKILLKLTSCFSNVRSNPNPEPLYISQFSILRSTMSCLEVLRRMSTEIKWRYVQLVSSDDFPLKTNLEMVRIFKALAGSQDCELVRNDVPEYMAFEHPAHHPAFKFTRFRRPVPPNGLSFYKGNYAASFTRQFVDFLFTNPTSVRYYRYLNGSQFPEEFYWQTLSHNIHLNPPGGFPGECLFFYETNREKKPWVSRFQLLHKDERGRCEGKIVQWSCLFGVRDLSKLVQRTELMAHALSEEFQPALLYCLEQWHWRRVCMANETGLHLGYYKSLPSVMYHNLSSGDKETYVCTV